jgi:hypothetical protein
MPALKGDLNFDGAVAFRGDVEVASVTRGGVLYGRAEVELTGLSGATATAASLIPAGSIVLNVGIYVTAAVTGATTLDIGDGTDVDAFGAAVSIALDTATNTASWTITTVPVYAAGSDVVLTANGGNFTGGAVRIVVTYLRGLAPAG